MADFLIELDGVPEMLEYLKTVKYEVSKKAVGAALAAAGQAYKSAMEAQVPSGHARYRYPGRTSAVTPYKYKYRGKSSKRIGTTRRAIKVRTYQDQDGPTVLVRVTRGTSATWDAFYAMFVVQGTKKQKNAILQPNKWAYRAANAGKPHAMEEFRVELAARCKELGFEDGEGKAV